jgi:hypothetical protein
MSLNNFPQFHCSVNGLKDSFRGVAEVCHEELNALRVNIFGARHVIFLGHVWELFTEAVPIEVLLGVVGLVLDNLVGHLNTLVAVLLA